MDFLIFLPNFRLYTKTLVRFLLCTVALGARCNDCNHAVRFLKF